MTQWNTLRRRLEKAATVRALIEDATRDTTLWLQANPSAEERVHVLAIQERLADLDRILARRMERRALPGDSQQWSEGVHDLLTHLKKAKQVRGNMVGQSLARLADHLPQQQPHVGLPEPIRPVNTARTVTQAPAPPREVGGLGLAPYQPKPAEVPHEPPMYFLSDLWPQTNVILLKAQRRCPLQTQTLELCKHIVSEMTPLFVEAVKAGKMKAANVLREHGGGMEDLLHLLLVHNDPGPHSGWGISNAAYRLGQEVRKSAEWLRLGEAIAEAQLLSTGEKEAQSSRAQNSGKTAQSVEGKPAVKSRNLGGRPRKDTERQLIREKKDAGKSWKEIANEVNQETGQQKTTDAYRSLLRSHSGNTKPPGKNGQN